MNGSRAATGAAVTTPMKERSWTRVSLASQRPGREWLPRAVYVVIVVLVTITLCYQLCVQFSVSPLIIRDFGMTFTSFVYISVVGNAIGAFASLAAGLADRWGRANLVMYGLLVTSVLVLVGLPNAPNKVTYLVLYAAVSLVEGMLLVATPALIRDFLAAARAGVGDGILDAWPEDRRPGGHRGVEQHAGEPSTLADPVRPARSGRARLTGLSLPPTRIPQRAGRRCRSLSRVIQSLEGTRPIGGGPGPRRGRHRKITT